MARKTNYHFLVLKRFPSGLSIVTLPGQTIGRYEDIVLSDIIVKDLRGKDEVRKAKKDAEEGDIFFTTSLARKNGCYTARDIVNLSKCDNLFLIEPRAAYEEYLNKNQSL